MTAIRPVTRHPQVLTAYDLLDGDVIFLGADGWSRDIRGAQVATTPDETARLAAIGMKAKAAALVADPYLVDVTVPRAGAPEPLHFREVLRTRGPSVRPDLGKQSAAAVAEER
ncbi:MAG: DUF2849 domain-containing protein [Alphaproteobacteria bacterium]